MSADEVLPGETETLGEQPGGTTGSAEQRFQLIVLSGSERGRRLLLSGGAKGETSIGKAPDNQLVLGDSTVSRRHCALRQDERGWILKDLDSTNGTFVEEMRVRETYLRPGTVFRVGAVQVRFASELTPVSVPPSAQTELGSLYGKSVKMREIFTLLERVSQSPAPVLLTGETGTGKGAVARAIHEQSGRSHGPFVTVDCGAIAATLIESELFGHEKGAFTGAEQRRTGALEQAHGGTLFIDEIDDLAVALQPKLLRALEDRTFQRLGSGQAIPFEARVIAATKRNLRKMVQQNAFREDLYFRIAVFVIEIPPLRARREDVAGLVDRFARALGRENTWATLPDATRGRLLGHAWPGNLRELRNTVERAFALTDDAIPTDVVWQLEDGGGLRARDAGLDADYEAPLMSAKEMLVERFEREYLVRLLKRSGGNMTRAAQLSKVSRGHLYTLLAKHGLGGESQ